MALQGTLDTFALPELLRLLAATKKTGRLQITGSRGAGSVWVVSGEVEAIEAPHVPAASGSVDALFELLRFEDGAFTFDAEAAHDDPGPAAGVETLLQQVEALLDEWHAIEAVVPSMDAWVTLRRTLPMPEVTLDQDRWMTIVAIGAGATVRRIGEELCFAELPISRAIKELAEGGFCDIADSPPAGVSSGASPEPAVPEIATSPTTTEVAIEAPTQPESFVPLGLPGHPDGVASRDAPTDAETPSVIPASPLGPSHGGVAVVESTEDDELVKQLATLSPRAASAIRAAAEAITDEERDAAIGAVAGDDDPLDRGLLLKFLSSVKS